MLEFSASGQFFPYLDVEGPVIKRAATVHPLLLFKRLVRSRRAVRGYRIPGATPFGWGMGIGVSSGGGLALRMNSFSLLERGVTLFIVCSL